MSEPLPRLVLVRPAPDRILHKAFLDDVPWEVAHQVAGEDVELGTAIPAIFRILAAPDAPAVFPQAPKKGDPLWVSLQYWYPLIQMLRYSLGWARLDKGLWWWYQENKPRTDPRLRILDDIYEGDGYLDGFCAWLWRGQGGIPTSYAFEQSNDRPVGWCLRKPRRRGRMSLDGAHRPRGKGRQYRTPDALGAGSDIRLAVEPSRAGTGAANSEPSRRATTTVVTCASESERSASMAAGLGSHR